MATVMYPYDDTGTAATNLVKNEVQVLTATNDAPYRYFIPKFAPFYETNFKMFGKDALGSERLLVFGVDYNFNLLYIGATRGNGSVVYGGVEIINAQIQGSVRLDYQCLGGKYSADRDYVVQVMAEQNYNPRATAWDQVTSIQELFPPSQHPQDLDTFTGYRDLIDSVNRLDGATDTQVIKDLIWKHILDHNDPHKTKDLLGEYAKKTYVDQGDQALGGRIDQSNAQIQKNTDDIEALKNGVVDDGDNFQQQITANKLAIEAANARIDGTNHDLVLLDTNVNEMNTRLTAKGNDNRQRIDNLKLQVEAMGDGQSQDLTALRAQVNANTGRIDGLTSQLTDYQNTTSAALNNLDLRLAAAEKVISLSNDPPTEFTSFMFVATAPHWRFMVWNGVKYIRAPWHQPGMLHYSYDNPSTGIMGYLPVRGDMAFPKATYPDLVERLGLAQDGGTFNLVEMRGEFLRILDNGRGIDVNRTLLSTQASQNLNHAHTTSASGTAGSITIPVLDTMTENEAFDYGLTWARTNGAKNFSVNTGGTGQTGTSGGTEARPRNIAVPLWVSY